jgi:dynein regulatory complex protein 1
MLRMLCDEASFLVPEDVAAQVAELEASGSVPPEETRALKADAILRALGVEDSTDVEALLSRFFDGSVEEEDFDDELAQIQDLGLKIGPDDVVSVCRAFMEEKQQEDGAVAAALAEAKANDASAAAAAAKRAARSREEQFWDEMANIVPQKQFRVWQALEKSMIDYVGQLNERKQLIDDVGALRSQNEELKGLLNQYLGAEVNAQLQVPPTQMIRLEGSGGGK